MEAANGGLQNVVKTNRKYTALETIQGNANVVCFLMVLKAPPNSPIRQDKSRLTNRNISEFQKSLRTNENFSLSNRKRTIPPLIPSFNVIKNDAVKNNQKNLSEAIQYARVEQSTSICLSESYNYNENFGLFNGDGLKIQDVIRLERPFIKQSRSKTFIKTECSRSSASKSRPNPPKRTISLHTGTNLRKQVISQGVPLSKDIPKKIIRIAESKKDIQRLNKNKVYQDNNELIDIYGHRKTEKRGPTLPELFIKTNEEKVKNGIPESPLKFGFKNVSSTLTELAESQEAGHILEEKDTVQQGLVFLRAYRNDTFLVEGRGFQNSKDKALLSNLDRAIGSRKPISQKTFVRCRCSQFDCQTKVEKANDGSCQRKKLDNEVTLSRIPDDSRESNLKNNKHEQISTTNDKKTLQITNQCKIDCTKYWENSPAYSRKQPLNSLPSSSGNFLTYPNMYGSFSEIFQEKSKKRNSRLPRRSGKFNDVRRNVTKPIMQKDGIPRITSNESSLLTERHSIEPSEILKKEKVKRKDKTKKTLRSQVTNEHLSRTRSLNAANSNSNSSPVRRLFANKYSGTGNKVPTKLNLKRHKRIFCPVRSCSPSCLIVASSSSPSSVTSPDSSLSPTSPAGSSSKHKLPSNKCHSQTLTCLSEYEDNSTGKSKKITPTTDKVIISSKSTESRSSGSNITHKTASVFQDNKNHRSGFTLEPHHFQEKKQTLSQKSSYGNKISQNEAQSLPKIDTTGMKNKLSRNTEFSKKSLESNKFLNKSHHLCIFKDLNDTDTKTDMERSLIGDSTHISENENKKYTIEKCEISFSESADQNQSDADLRKDIRSFRTTVCGLQDVFLENPDFSEKLPEFSFSSESSDLRTQIKIYTDWANHYLDKGRSKRHISDLQVDVTDGVILADVIEAVTGQKVPDINKKPKNSSHMLENVNASLSFLEKLGVQLDSLTSKDIKDGNLKAILSLFFALSRYKQQQKQALQERRELEKLREKKQESENHGPLSRLSSPYKSQVGSGSAIPTPNLGGRRPPGEHHARGTGRSSQASNSANGVSAKSNPTTDSRSTSPANGGSFIPTPRSHGSRASEKHKSTTSNGQRPVKTSHASPHHAQKQKDSMLDKLKLFGNKEKDAKIKSSNSSGVSKRTSSSSGFSSARSERSDSSSTSLCSDARPPPLPPHQTLPGSTTSSSSGEQQTDHPPGKSPGLRGIRSRFSRGTKDSKESSPRSSRRSDDSKSSPRSSHRTHRTDQRDNKTENKRSGKLTLDLSSAPRCLSPLHPDPSVKTSKVSSTRHQVSSKETSTSNPSKASPMTQSGGSCTPNSPLSSSSSGTGIPKPTAAVKGTTKISQDKNSPNVNTTTTKDYQNKMARTTSSQKKGSETTEVKDPKGSLPRQRNLGGRREDSGPPPTVAMVSPMVVASQKDFSSNSQSQVTNSESGSALSEASHNSGHSNSNSSGNSSVIYKPNVSEEEKQENHIKKEIGEMVLKSDDGEDVVLDIKPMQPLSRATHYGLMRGLGNMAHQGRTLPPSLHVSRLALQENSNTVPQKGMRMTPPHLKRQLASGSPKLHATQSTDTDYSDIESIDLTNGYMSDGDVLRQDAGCRTYPGSDFDGYLSEGGASLYAHRLSQRFKEGMRQVHESMSKVQQFMQDDSQNPDNQSSSRMGDSNRDEDSVSCPDSDYKSIPSPLSCSISSSHPALSDFEFEADTQKIQGMSQTVSNMKDICGDDVIKVNVMSSKPPIRVTSFRYRRKVATTFDDSSSLSSGVSDTLNELSEDLLSSLSMENATAITKAKGLTDVGLKLPVGLSGTSGRRAGLGMDPSGAYKVVSSKAHVTKIDNSQLPENGAFRHISNTQWKKYVEAGKPEDQRNMDPRKNIVPKKAQIIQHVPGPHLGPPVIVNPMVGKRDKKGIMEKQKVSPQINGDSRKLQNPKTAPSNFGYNRRASTGTSGSVKANGKMKQESTDGSSSLDRPRTKVKVSGGTQTTSDLQYMPAAGFHSDGEYSSNSLGRKYQQLKTYSLSGTAAAQLSQGVRERILQSPYRKVHVPTGEFVTYTPGYYRERNSRLKHTDGSLSDSPYSNYAEIQYASNPYGTQYSWVSRGNYATSVASAPTRPIGANLTEADSMESLSSTNSNLMAAQLQHARATNLTQARLMMHQREMATSPSPRLARSNSVRSAKSEKILGLRDGYHNSQPTSPTPASSNRLTQSPLNTARGSPYYSSLTPRKDDECHGSTLSLVSSSSSLYSSQEEKQAAELRKLKVDLTHAQEKVHTLTNQLTTNAHVVAAFEQSLTNMTNRLQQLAASSEQKDSELMELRKTIDALRQQSIDAGLTVACLQSMSPQRSTKQLSNGISPNKPPPHPQNPITSGGLRPMSPCRPPSNNGTPDTARRHTFTGTCRDVVNKGESLVRGTSVESVSSLSSACSGNSHTSGQDKLDGKNKKKGWLRTSFTKAFSRNPKGKKGTDGPEYREYSSVPPSPVPNRPDLISSKEVAQDDREEIEIELLKRQLWEKDMVLTDIRLEALTSAHQLESMKEMLNKMRSEMKNLKDNNERLQRMMVSKSLDSSQVSLHQEDHRSSLSEIHIEDTTDILLIDPLDKDSKRITISVFCGGHGVYEKYINPGDDNQVTECVIGAISVSSKTKWDILDNLVRRIFKEFLLRIDPISNLGISSESVLSYHLGDLSRHRESEAPELLPCGYLVGDVNKVRVVLKGSSLNCVDALAFETLVAKSIIQRYVSLLTEHRRIILCGPNGTGKTFLAKKLAEFLVCRLGKDPSPENIATFSVDHKSGKDIGAYLSHISDQCETNASELPMVIILDNLHHAGSLTEVFNGFLSAKYTQCPFIIGTMNQVTSCSTTNLQLHHNFRWVLMANHMEPVKGLLSRISRRKLTLVEVETSVRQPRLQQILDWLPKCWATINKFLETHSSSDVTIGPRLFLSCPGSIEGSQIWFTDLWNYTLVPYMVEAVREGLQLYGKRASWEDPTTWITETYPWPPTNSHAGAKSLVSLRPEDVGYDSSVAQDKSADSNKEESDPLLSMLMKLQEAANFPGSQEQTTMSLENMENALESTL